MYKLKKLLITIFLGISLVGCAAYGISPVTGLVVTDVKGTYGGVTPASAYTKIGKASCYSILGLFAFGDCSVGKAMYEGGILKIHHVDYKTESFLGIYAKHTVIVYGD